MKVILTANTAWNLYHYRLPLADMLAEAGAEVVMACPPSPDLDLLAQRYRVVPWQLSRGSLNPLNEARALDNLHRIYRQERPDIAHHFTIHANVCGGLAAQRLGIPHINHWTGLGWSFTKPRMRWALGPLLRWSHRGAFTVTQTESDKTALLGLGVDVDAVIPGSGVNTARFAPHEAHDGRPVVLMASRLLRDKGVTELCEAAASIDADVWIAGAVDPGNRRSLTAGDAMTLHATTPARFLGHRNDVPELLARADIAVLPTAYNEGVPLFLLEAAASGLPVVGTPVCGSIVRQGETGLIVQPRDATDLANALRLLVDDPTLRAKLGDNARKVAVSDFDQRVILAAYRRLYAQLGLPVPERTAA